MKILLITQEPPLRSEDVVSGNAVRTRQIRDGLEKAGHAVIQTYLSSRVMSVAANEMDMDVVMAPCNGCYHNLKKAEYDLANDGESAAVVDRLSKGAPEIFEHVPTPPVASGRAVTATEARLKKYAGSGPSAHPRRQ